MRVFGWAVAVVAGTYATYVFVRSIPDVVRYMKLRSI